MKLPRLVLDQKKLDTAMHKIANRILAEIRQNTRRGVDSDGNQFQRYSEPYLKYKTRYMAKGKQSVQKAGVSSATVNLILTGKMMDSISVSKFGTAYHIYFIDKDRALIAYYHHTGKKQPKRAFFGVSASREKAIYEEYMKDVARFA